MKLFLGTLPLNTVFQITLSFIHFLFKTPVKNPRLALSPSTETKWISQALCPSLQHSTLSMRLCGNQATCNDEEESLQQRFPLCRPVATDNVCNVIPLVGDFKREGI
jgi:hypothetical protein